MNITKIKQILEKGQIHFYWIAVTSAALIALVVQNTTALEAIINPALAFMLFVTFLQVPLSELGKSLKQKRFFAALFLVNFLLIPIFVFALMQLLPNNTLVRLGVLMVLLTPCIDYVVTFSHLGHADARLLLAATPALLIIQILLLPFFLQLFIGSEIGDVIQIKPFAHAFLWLIALPLLLAGIFQQWASKTKTGEQTVQWLEILPVPATALVLFVVVASVTPQIDSAIQFFWYVIPVYMIFSAIAPLIGWGTAKLFKLEAPTGRAVSFSAGTRNSLVVLPLALSIPNAIPILPAIIVTQTLIELISELFYIRFIAMLGKSKTT